MKVVWGISILCSAIAVGVLVLGLTVSQSVMQEISFTLFAIAIGAIGYFGASAVQQIKNNK